MPLFYTNICWGCASIAMSMPGKTSLVQSARRSTSRNRHYRDFRNRTGSCQWNFEGARCELRVSCLSGKRGFETLPLCATRFGAKRAASSRAAADADKIALRTRYASFMQNSGQIRKLTGATFVATLHEESSRLVVDRPPKERAVTGCKNKVVATDDN